jgi:hypothetical protein
MLHIFPKSFLKSSSRLGDPWTDRRGCPRDLKFGLLCSCLANSPHGVSWLSVLRVHHLFLSVFLFPFFQSSSVAESLADGPPGVRGQSARSVLVADGSRCLHRWSVIVGAVLEACESFSDNPPLPRRRSTVGSRTVRLVVRWVAKSFAS